MDAALARFDRSAVRTPNSAANERDFLAGPATTRSQGFALEDQENELGITCVAVGIPDLTGQTTAAIPVSTPSVHMTGERIGRLVSLLRGLEAAVEHIAIVQSVSAGTAERFLNRAETLATDLPEVLEALAAGSNGGSHVDAIADQALRITPRTIPAPDASDQAAVETWVRAVSAEERAAKASRNELGLKLLTYADGRNPASIHAKGKYLLEQYDPESFSKRSKKALEGRFFGIEPGGEGLAYLTVALEAKDTRELDGDEPAEATAHSAGDMPEEGDDPPEVRTMDQLRTDVFSDHMLVGPDGSGLENVQAHVTVTVPATLLPGLRADDEHACNQHASGLGDAPLPPGADVPTAQRLGPIDEKSAAMPMAQAPPGDGS